MTKSTPRRFPRLRTHYHLHRTNTGRLSSGMDPTEGEKKGGKVAQVHNIPKVKKPGDLPIRSMFRADPGKVLLNADWAAIQWALCMWHAGQLDNPPGHHLRLLDQHQAGELDPHTYLASHFGGNAGDMSKVTHEQRQLAKIFTYGRMFKGELRVLAYEAKRSLKEAEEIGEAYEQAFRLGPWWDHVQATVLERRYIEEPGGWRRYFFSPVRYDKVGQLRSPKMQEVLAALIQGSEATVLKFCLGSMFKDTPSWLEILTTTHDSVLVQVPEGLEEAGSQWLRKHMEQPVPWFDNRSWRSDVQVGQTWQDVS